VTAELRPRGIHVHTVNPGFVETEGFPQRAALRSAVFRRLVIDPEDVAAAVLRALDRDRPEIFVPGWFRIAAVAQAVIPGLVGRISSRSGYRPTIAP
jgi:short-subunit dehydrogenase